MSLMLGIPYLFYIQDEQVWSGLWMQQEKIAKSFYILLTEYFNTPTISVSCVNKVLLGAFSIIYFFTCIVLLNKKQIKFRIEMRKANYFIMAFLFLLLTNFQPWYLLWLFPLLLWQRAENIRLVIQLSLISQFVNAIFLTYGEGWKNGTPFVFFMVTGTLIAVLWNHKKEYKI